jgi:TolB-like protein/DNA-binding winged helix-turn-helix (wHTH) protein/Tfp pilus assembly protein PilF
MLVQNRDKLLLLDGGRMEQAPSRFRVLRFGVFEVDLERGELRKSGMLLKLVGQPFQVLQLLLEHPQEVVTRDELRQRLWTHDTFVDYDLALKRIINRLREVLGDSAENPRFIETIPRRGYRFIAAVNENGVAAPSLEDRPEAGKTVETRWSCLDLRIRIALSLGAAVLLGAMLALVPANLWQRLSSKSTVPRIRSLAVLPLANLSGDPAQEYFSDGLTDALITDLAQFSSVKVISRTSSMQYKQTKKSLPEISRELNVDGIIEGTVQRSGDRVRITAELIHGPSDKHLWANGYERDTRDIFALERDLTEEIARQVQARLAVPKQMPLPQPRPVDPKVLDAYVQGNYHLNGRGHGGGDEEHRKAQTYFEEAIDADPNFAPAYIGLANAHDVLSEASSDDLVLMRRAAEKAVALDPTSSDAWTTLGGAKWEAWDWYGAEEEFRRALALNPNNAYAHDVLAATLDVTGHLDEGWKEFQLAQELDPNQDHLADALYQRGQYDRAIEIRQRISLRDPKDGYNYYALAMNYAQKGMYKEFAEQLETAFTLYGLPENASRLKRAYDKSGSQGALQQWAKDLEYLGATKQLYFPGVLAQLYATLGEKDRAFYWLEQYRQHHDLALADPTMYFKTDPWFASIRSDPRFSDFLRRVGLPQ